MKNVSHFPIKIMNLIESLTEKKTTVALSEETKEQLANFGKKGESFDSILQRVMSSTDSLCNPPQNDDSEEQKE